VTIPVDVIEARHVPRKKRPPNKPVSVKLTPDHRYAVAKRVKALANTLRAELQRRGTVITAPVELELVTVARLTCRLEIVISEASRGIAPIDDTILTRLANAQARGLNRLGLNPLLLAPPPPKPVPKLSALLAQQQGAPR
jgi:hypothetical protein